MTESIWISEPELIEFVIERVKFLKFKSKSEYYRALLKKDKEGRIEWKEDSEKEKDKILEFLQIICEKLNIPTQDLTKKEIKEKLIKIGENVPLNEAIQILTKEEVL